ncbi:MAG: VWA domain-containing protein [Treponema sp.]|jgi:hypothetical protein|nr:VWA domain-containing protein [Treponema sp.]
MKLKNLRKSGFFVLFALLGGLLWADTRAVSMDVYIIVDGSSSMEKGKEEAVAWICTTVLDGRVQDGDRLLIWVAGSSPELIFSGTGAGREDAKRAVRAIQFRGGSADYRGALGEAKRQLRRGRLSYTLLVSGSEAKDTPAQARAESAGLLRFSRVDSFSGWRVLTVGLDVDGGVDRASSYYMENKKN